MSDASSHARGAIRGYRDLEVYKRAMNLLAPPHTVARRLPAHERFELASQLRRASKSIPANIAEGYGKKDSAREFKAYLNNALGSANEVMVHLEIASALQYVPDGDIQDLIDEYTVLAKQLHRLRENWRTFSPSKEADHASRLSHPASSG
jgi:four helix bundle protein